MIVVVSDITACRTGREVTSGAASGYVEWGKEDVISTTYQNNGHEQERKMSNQQDWIVGADMSRTARQVQAELERFFIMNEEYNKVICISEGCRKAIKARAVQGHLQRKHNVEGVLSKRIADAIGEEVGWRWRPSNKRLPVNGLGPQKGLEVFKRFQCRFCNELPARTVEEVEHHLYEMHRETEGHIWDEVPVQSWGGEGTYECWVVDERKCSGGKAIMEVVEEAAPAEEVAADDAAAEEAIADDAPAETAVDDAMADDAAAEEDTAREMDPKEIPEESECWSEEESQEEREGCNETENFDGWEGDCFGWKWREAEHAGWDEMAGDWVVMY